MKRLNLFFGAAALVAVSLTASPSINAQENGNRDENGKIVRVTNYERYGELTEKYLK